MNESENIDNWDDFEGDFDEYWSMVTDRYPCGCCTCCGCTCWMDDEDI